MREYLSESNLRKALLVSAVCTLASLPRILHGGMNPAFYVPAAFISLTLVAGMATAWDKRGGMAGLWPDRKHQLTGIGLAVLMALILIPIALKTDPAIKAAFESADSPKAVILQYPESPGGVTALILWSVSFEFLLFVAACAAVFARLFNRRWAAIIGPVLIRVAVAHYQLTTGHVTDASALILMEAAIMTAGATILFTHYGIAAPVVFIALLETRLFF